jgi:O-antigen/teichoic acid export membrane protein
MIKPVQNRSTRAVAMLGQNQASVANSGVSLQAHQTPTGFLKVRKQFLFSALAGLGNLAGSQVLRLAGNLALTRLLFPEVFGLMALVNVFLMGIALLSDLGIGASIVQRAATPDLTYLRTAWTLQTLRAVLLWFVTTALAWPLAHFYNEPKLLLILPAVGITQIIAGFESTAVHLCVRNLRQGLTEMLDLATAVVGTASAILIAWWYQSVWALVISGMISAVFRTTVTYFLPGQIQHRFALDRAHVRELVHFGKWLLLASAFTFLASEGDRIILGKFLTLSQLGIYTVAFFFAQAVTMVTRGISQRVLFPVLSRLKEESQAVQVVEFRRYYLLILGASLLPIGIFLLGGPLIIEVLYDDRYLMAGPLLQILALGASGATLRALIGPVLLSRGNSYGRMLFCGVEAFTILVTMSIGGAIWGLYGFTGGFVVAQYLAWLPGIYYLRKYGVWCPKIDLLYLTITTFLAVCGFLLWPDRL